MADRLESLGQATSTTYYYADKLGIEAALRLSIMYNEGDNAVYPIRDDAFPLKTVEVGDPLIYYNQGAACVDKDN